MSQSDTPANDPANALAHKPPAGPFAEPRPSMRGRYLIRNPRVAGALAALDAGLALLPVRKRPVPSRLQRILLSNWGHLGDVVTTFGAIAALRERHPGVEIGMIVSSWARPAVEKAGLVDRIHVIDHWWVSRAKTSGKQKRRRFRETRDAALREIKAVGYEAGIDFYPFFAPAHVLFYKAGIMARVGFTSSGGGPLLTHPVPWADRDAPVADHYRGLLDALHPGRPFAPEALRPRRDRTTLVDLPAILAGHSPYLVVHPGAGATYKEWGLDRWEALIARIGNEYPGHRIVLTGAGAAEVAMTEELATRLGGLINLAGHASWEEFVSVIAHAALVVCPDTATGHVAALFDVPTVSIFTGTNNAAQWGPYSDKARVLMRPVVCAPCYRAGCEAVECIRGVEPDEAMNAIRSLLPHAPAARQTKRHEVTP
ncbi:glycosyltransferase family 9 protein [Hoeflea sp.]|uniref:glycosyltransferase family 9 protein n=1 Tax=Hoeflea sp. TaxID=1940281 RepID=UPI001997A554|nr:glycosyltransferase family 9 protein [Hoeflea sp.]MBC7281920.1 glycosyltransferase family 9 protein [Hoeflea sp.]